MTDLVLVVPAAGLGSRFYGTSPAVPKTMVQVHDKPILQYVLDAGLQAQVCRVVIIVGRGAGIIKSTFAHSYRGVPLEYVSQPEPLGLAHAVSLAAPFVSEAMMVINGDEIFVGSRHAPMRALFDRTGAEAVVGFLTTGEPERIRIGYGLDLAPDGRVLRLEEKPVVTWNNLLGVGTWLLRRTFFEYYARTPVSRQRGEKDMVAVIQTMIGDLHSVYGFDLRGRFFNINTRADLERARSALATSGAAISSPEARL